VRTHPPRLDARLHIRTRNLTLQELEGAYRSRTRARSLEFDDLREYAPGDDPRDIDWKATARHGSALVRRHEAHRLQTVTFVVTTGREMSALSEDGDRKVDIAVDVIGALGALAARHQDRIGLVGGDSARLERVADGTGERHVARLTRLLTSRVTADSPVGDPARVMVGARRSLRRAGIVVVVADEFDADDGFWTALRSLVASRDVLWVTITDADPFAPRRGVRVDAGTRRRLPRLPPDRQLAQEYREATQARRHDFERRLATLRIRQVRVASRAQTLEQLQQLLRLPA